MNDLKTPLIESLVGDGPECNNVKLERQVAAPPWSLRLFRRLVLANSVLSAITQVVVVVLFSYQIYASQAYQFSAVAPDRGYQYTINTIAIPIWFSTGFIYEYLFVLLGRGVYVRWGGISFVAAPILHLLVGIHLIFNHEMRVNGHSHGVHFVVYNTMHLIGLGVYFYLLRYNLGSRTLLQKIYTCKDKTVLCPSLVKRLIEETNESFDLDMNDSFVRHLEDELNERQNIASYVEGLSAYASVWPCNQFSSATFRLLSTQLLLNEDILLLPHDDEAPVKEFAHHAIPLTSYGMTLAIFEKWIKVPLFFTMTCVSVLVVAVVVPIQATFLGKIINGINAGNSHDTAVGMIVWGSLLFVAPLGHYMVAFSQSQLNARALSLCRRSLLMVIFHSESRFFDSVAAEAAIVDTFTSQMARIEVLLVGATFTLLSSMLQLLMGVVFALRLNYLAGLSFAAMIPIMYSVDDFTQLALNESKASTVVESKLATQFSSSVHCLPIIRSSNATSWAVQRLDDLLNEHREKRSQAIFFSSTIKAYYQSCGNIYTALCIIPWGLHAINGSVSSGDFATLVALTAGMIEPLNLLGNYMRTTASYAGSMAMVNDMLHKGAKFEEGESLSGEDITLTHLQTSINMKDVLFYHSGKTSPSLNGVSLTIRKGTYVAICGSSGAGKSTCLKLLMQEYSPSSGSIEWDGVSIGDCTLTSYRNQVGVMFQQALILHGSVRENITFGTDANMDEVGRAANLAGISQAIDALPSGYETIIGSGSSNGLSGGEIQRVCLARLLCRRCSVLLLDEATSGLDPITEAAIIDTMLCLRDTEGMTIISVTHHPATTTQADEIVVLDKGMVTERGTYNNLIQNDSGRFYKMVNGGE